MSIILTKNLKLMKTYLLVSLLIGLTNPMIAQNDIAALTLSNKTANTTNNEILNAEYLNTVAHQGYAIKIQELQNLVAKYNIKTAVVYQPESNGTYTVEFKDADNQITAVYDRNGQLISSQENYKSIKLPIALLSKIVKDNPNCTIEKVYCKIQYIKNKKQNIVYQVVINNENKSKKITIKV